jgi:hypothetical protein
LHSSIPLYQDRHYLLLQLYQEVNCCIHHPHLHHLFPEYPEYLLYREDYQDIHLDRHHLHHLAHLDEYLCCLQLRHPHLRRSQQIQ